MSITLVSVDLIPLAKVSRLHIHSEEVHVQQNQCRGDLAFIRDVIQEKDWTLDLEISFDYDNYNQKLLNVDVSGAFFDALESLMMMSNAKEPELSVSVFIGQKPEKMVNEGLENCFWMDLKLPKSFRHEEKWRLDVKLNGLLELKQNVKPSELHNWQLLKTGPPGDFALVAGDGTKVFCHKEVLLEASPALKSMINPTSLLENEVMLEEVSSEGINALLEFLYCRVMFWPKKSAKICLELFQAANKFTLPVLEEMTKQMLLEAHPRKFDADLILRFYKFVQVYKGKQSRELKRKIVSVLINWEEKCAFYKEVEKVFQDAAVAKDLFFLALEFNVGKFSRIEK